MRSRKTEGTSLYIASRTSSILRWTLLCVPHIRSRNGSLSPTGRDLSPTEPQRMTRSFAIGGRPLLEFRGELRHRVTCKVPGVLSCNLPACFPAHFREPSPGVGLDDLGRLLAVSFHCLSEFGLFRERA